MITGDGRTGRFWEDRWINGWSVSEIALQLYACIPKRRRKRRTVADGLRDNNWARNIRGTVGIEELGQYLYLWCQVVPTTLPEQPDQLIWKWTASGSYTAKSCYLASFQGSMACNAWKLIWKNWAPPSVKFFHWLANRDSCWTAERLRRHALQHHPRCLLFDQEPRSMQHLLTACPFSRQVWHETLSWLRIPCRPPENEPSLHDWWIAARQTTPKPMRKGLSSEVLLVA